MHDIDISLFKTLFSVPEPDLVSNRPMFKNVNVNYNSNAPSDFNDFVFIFIQIEKISMIISIEICIDFRTYVLKRPAVFSRPLIFATAFMSFFLVVIALFKVSTFVFLLVTMLYAFPFCLARHNKLIHN